MLKRPVSKGVICQNHFRLNSGVQLIRKDFRRVKGMLPRSHEDRQAKPVRVDGNTVQLDEEMLAMNRNALNYEYLSRAVGSSIKTINKAIKGQV